jgi:hypothetical protein
MKVTPATRILAIDLRANRIAFAALDASGGLLDFGAPRFESPRTARVRVGALFGGLHPSVVVLRRLRLRSTRRRPRWKSVLRVIQSEAKWLNVPVAWVTERALKKHFRDFGCRNKFQVAELLAAKFPQIAWKLPRARKAYEPEPWAICYFDAISLGEVHLALTSEESRSSSRQDEALSPASK